MISWSNCKMMNHILKWNHWFWCWQSILPSYIFKHSGLRPISKIRLSDVWVVFVDVWKKQEHQKCTCWPLFALLYCLHFNYALLSELTSSLAKAIRNGGAKPDSDVLLDVYRVIHLADLRASLRNVSVMFMWVAHQGPALLLQWFGNQPPPFEF